MRKVSLIARSLFQIIASTALTVWSLLAIPREVFAYTLLESLPGLPAGDVGLGAYLTVIFTIGIGLAGVLAVLMIVIGGVQYIGSGMSPSGKEDAKGRITNAIFGLLLALTSWLILNVINPDLVSINFKIPALSAPTSLSDSGSSVPFASMGGCQTNCTTLTGLPQKPPGSGCAAPGPCTVDASVAGKLQSLGSMLKDDGTLWQITEMYPPTRQHKDPCHQEATCVDASLRGASTGNAEDIRKFMSYADMAGLRAVYEVSSTAERDRLQAAGVPNVVYVGAWITGDHFSVYDK